MNSRQLLYAIRLSETRNFSQVADKLNITQPALSKQILTLESELGVKLFDRSTTPLSLTPAGEHFIREAKDLLYREDQLQRSMDRFRSGEAGRLVIGISPFRSLYLMPHLAEKLLQRFPGIQITLQETGSDQLRKDVLEGKYDFAIINLPVDESLLETIPLEPDRLVLAVPNTLLDKLPETARDPKAQIRLQDCSALPFITVGNHQEMRRLFDQLCAKADLVPNVIMEVVGITTAWAMAHAGLGATLLPIQFLNNDFFDQNVTLFTVVGSTLTRQPAVVYRRGQYLSDCARYAIDLLTKQQS